MSYRNSLDALRLLAAGMVLYSHQHPVMGLAEPTVFGLDTWGGVGVSIFFFLSGFLVWSSWLRDRNVIAFLQRRVLRIFPALWILVLLTVFMLGPCATTLDTQAYFLSKQTWSYLQNLWLNTTYYLPGVFLGSPLQGAVNASLWTLPVEFACYLALVVVGSAGNICRVSNTWSVIVLWWLSIILVYIGPQLSKLPSHSFEMGVFFAAGIVYGQMRLSRMPFVPLMVAISGLVLIVVMSEHGLQGLGLLLISVGLVHGASRWSGCAWISKSGGDVSYGVYIYAFPLQQIVALWSYSYGIGFVGALAMSTVATLVLAYISWHIVEKPALMLKPKTMASPS